jgi:hypothetical protein
MKSFETKPNRAFNRNNQEWLPPRGAGLRNRANYGLFYNDNEFPRGRI